MEPRSFKRGNHSPATLPAGSFRCFNGAALFQARKPKSGLQSGAACCVASMEPRSFKRGNIANVSPESGE